MSNTQLIIEERSRDIGDFLVGRLIPFRTKKMVGPFSFIDHMGPTVVGNGKYMDIGQHPHIGLSTLTYLFEGEMMHRDSTGAVQRITPGDVGWMTAGSGVVHTERTPENLRTKATFTLHGFQIWVALPKDKEEMAPSFSFTPKEMLPVWEENNLQFTLIAGEGFGKKSPVPVYSHLFMVQLIAKQTQVFQLKGQLKGEIGICVVQGYIEACNNKIDAGNMLISKEEDVCNITVAEKTRLLIFGGTPFKEERFIEWNFVASSKEKIEAAKQRWIDQQFTMVPNETGYIPLPESPFKK